MDFVYVFASVRALKEKSTSAINTKLGTLHRVHGSHSVRIDAEVKRSKVKVMWLSKALQVDMTACISSFFCLFSVISQQLLFQLTVTQWALAQHKHTKTTFAGVSQYGIFVSNLYQ